MAANTIALEEILAVRAGAQKIASAAVIADVLDRLAAEISSALADASPVLLAVMRGGVFTATELARRLDWPYEFDYVHPTRYGSQLEGGELEWVKRPGATLRDRHVLIVDDVLDRGQTLAELVAAIEQLQPRKVYSTVLVEKALRVPVDRPVADFVGLRVDDRYLFGCGMDYRGFWRGLPELFAVGDA